MSELVKTALSPSTVAAMTRAVKGFGAGAGMGGLVGGAAGGALGAGKRYSEAREGGAGLGQSLKAGLGGLGGGALRGMALGAAAGGVGGAAAPSFAQGLSKVRGLKGASNFGQRQVHSLTGVGDAAYIRSIGGGAAYAEKNLAGAREALQSADAAGHARAVGGVLKARKAFDASAKSEAMGLTSIPGYAKALYKNPKEALTTGIKDQWLSMGSGGRALMYGLPVASAVGEAAKKTDGSGKERGRLERAGRTFGVAASGMLAPLSIAADVVAGGALSSGMGRLGRGADHLMRRKQVQRPVSVSSPEPGGGTAQAEGYQLSDRAAGTAAEGITG